MRDPISIRGALGFALVIACSQAAPVEPKLPDALAYPADRHIQLHGHLGHEIDLSIHHRILAQSVEEFIRPMRERKDKEEWRSEFWGKWITSAILAYTQQPEPALRAKIADAVAQLIATQTRDGYIGSHSPQNHLQRWDIWGRKYCMLGLIAWYDASGDQAALAAARREADFTLTEVGPGKGNMFRHDMWHGVACSSVLEPMVLLYRRTGDKRYLDFCEWLLSEWQKPYGPDLERKALAGIPVYQMYPGPRTPIKNYLDGGESKAYEMMSCFEGLVELYRTTGERSHLEAAQRVWENIHRTEITVIGSGSDWERWCNGGTRQTEEWIAGMETCVTATWIKLSAQLLRATGDSRYADAIEIAAYNALLGAQAPDGSWWVHYEKLTGLKHDTDGQCGLNENCCVVNGPRALMLLPDLAVMQSAEGPVINLYGTLTASIDLPHGPTVKIDITSDYPANGQVTCHIDPAQPSRFTVKLRIPAWCQGARVSVNGQPQNGVVSGRYAALTRRWNAGDTIQAEFPLPVRVLPAPTNSRYFALARGPIVLARDARLEAAIDRPIAGEVGPLHLLATAPESNLWLKFAAADGGQFCDFASAGDTWKADSRFRIWFEHDAPPRG